jgi:hypothetical protein
MDIDGKWMYTYNVHSSLKPPPGGCQVSLVSQPAQSPDTHVLDFATFPSFGRRVGKAQKHESLTDLDTLWKNIKQIIEEIHGYVRTRGLDTKTRVSHEIQKAMGGNDFKLPHKK